jgi:glycosyltransferase involved in cell wall biosynthesis
MKISIGSKIFEGPWGGGNLFVKNFSEYLTKQGVSVVHDLYDQDIDVIILMDPRKSSYSSTFTHKDIVNYKKYINNKVFVIHRFNECDERKGTVGLNKFLIQANKVSDKNIYVSNWLREVFYKEGIERKNDEVIMTGANTEIFNSKHFLPWDGSSRLKIVTHHWGTNINKGFEVYKQLDNYLGVKENRDRYEFTYIGKLPEDFSLVNSNHIEPLSGLGLAKELKKSHLYLTASRNEPSGNHHIEAAQCGLPILYLNSGGIPEFCKGFGMPFEKSDFFHKLEKIRSDYSKYSQNMKNYPFNSEKMSEEYYFSILKMLKDAKYMNDISVFKDNRLVTSKNLYILKRLFGKIFSRVYLFSKLYNLVNRLYLKIKQLVVNGKDEKFD